MSLDISICFCARPWSQCPWPPDAVALVNVVTANIRRELLACCFLNEDWRSNLAKYEVEDVFKASLGYPARPCLQNQNIIRKYMFISFQIIIISKIWLKLLSVFSFFKIQKYLLVSKTEVKYRHKNFHFHYFKYRIQDIKYIHTVVQPSLLSVYGALCHLSASAQKVVLTFLSP